MNDLTMNPISVKRAIDEKMFIISLFIVHRLKKNLLLNHCKTRAYKTSQKKQELFSKNTCTIDKNDILLRPLNSTHAFLIY